jgi:hypothetical protein
MFFITKSESNIIIDDGELVEGWVGQKIGSKNWVKKLVLKDVSNNFAVTVFY